MSASRISLKDSYYLYRGASNLFCLQGYSPPRTQLLKGKSLALQTAKKCELFPAIKNKGRDPSPVDYADGQEKWLKSTWLKPTGKFLPSKRETMTEKCMKASLKSPGPGAYSPSPTQISRTLGKFKYLLNSKGDSRTLLNNTQALAEEVPGPNEYYKILADRDKAYSLMEQRTPKFKYIQSDKNKKIDEKRNEVGPGYLKDLEKSLMAVEPKSPGPIFLKSKKVSKFQKDAEKMKFVPGVGAYENVEKAFKKFVITKKDGNVFTSRARLVRSTERAEKDKRWVPGPGSYNAISFFKEKG